MCKGMLRKVYSEFGILVGLEPRGMEEKRGGESDWEEVLFCTGTAAPLPTHYRHCFNLYSLADASMMINAVYLITVRAS